MKALLAAIFFAASAVAFVGCESDVPPTANSGANTLERGISGKGTLTEPDKSDDPVTREETRTGN